MNPHKAVDYIRDHAAQYAEAKSQRKELERFRKVKKALLMNELLDKPQHARESYAYAHPEYLEISTGIKIVEEKEIKLEWELIAAQARIEVWRTEQANNRFTENV